jgi:hypothetical protein
LRTPGKLPARLDTPLGYAIELLKINIDFYLEKQEQV